MTLKIQTARKDHICSECRKRIPAGVRYWCDFEPVGTEGFELGKNVKTHTNCLDFEDEPILNPLTKKPEKY